MGWNRSDNCESNKQSLENTGKSLSHGLIAGALVILVGVGVLSYYFLKDDSTRAVKYNESKPTSAISTVTNATVHAETQENTKPIDPNARPTKIGEIVNGYVMLPSGRIHKRAGIVTNSVSATLAKSPYSIFEHRSDNTIANLIMAKPGASVVGTPHWGWFEKDFLNSIKTPIIVSKDDTPEQAELKRAVVAAKLELKDAYDRGEDITKIVAETRQQLQDLYKYKAELRMMYIKEKKSCESLDDIQTLREACNKMLETKGIQPLEFTPLTRHNLEMNKEK